MILPGKGSKTEPALEWAVGQPLIMGEKFKKQRPDPKQGAKTKKAKSRMRSARKASR